MKPIIAIVGRPNVGKSTLFNRLARKRKAIVENEPGVTRDRIYAETSWNDQAFILIDTGGFEPTAKERMAQQVREQAEVAIQEADLILFLMDGKEGLTPTDTEAADYLRKIAKPVFYVVNKIDGERHEDGVIDFFRLGVERLFSISAAHGRGVGDLMDEVMEALPPSVPEEERREEEIRVALIGRPNVGKSSLLNKLLGRPRAMVDSQPGTTRDAIDTPLSRDGKKYVFIDTAGLRRKSRITQRLEKYSTIRALKSLERCDVALVLIDGYEGLTEQDARITEFAAECGRAILLIVNKWDLVQKDSRTSAAYKERISREMKTLDFVPVLFVSALTGQRVSRIFAAIEQVVGEYRKRIPTGNLNQWLQETLQKSSPPIWRGRPGKIYFLSQVAASPPTFVFFMNHPQAVTESYQRFLLRRLRERYGFAGVPIRFLFRQRKKESS
jgi:GTP-binding protein